MKTGHVPFYLHNPVVAPSSTYQIKKVSNSWRYKITSAENFFFTTLLCPETSLAVLQYCMYITTALVFSTTSNKLHTGFPPDWQMYFSVNVLFTTLLYTCTLWIFFTDRTLPFSPNGWFCCGKSPSFLPKAHSIGRSCS